MHHIECNLHEANTHTNTHTHTHTHIHTHKQSLRLYSDNDWYKIIQNVRRNVLFWCWDYRIVTINHNVLTITANYSWIRYETSLRWHEPEDVVINYITKFITLDLQACSCSYIQMAEKNDWVLSEYKMSTYCKSKVPKLVEMRHDTSHRF